MTINEAMDAAITAVAQDKWDRYCRLELPIYRLGEAPVNEHRLWGWVIDPLKNLESGLRSETPIAVWLHRADLLDQVFMQRLKHDWKGNWITDDGMNHPSCDPDANEWHEWTEPPDYASRFGKRRSYAAWGNRSTDRVDGGSFVGQPKREEPEDIPDIPF